MRKIAAVGESAVPGECGGGAKAGSGDGGGYGEEDVEEGEVVCSGRHDIDQGVVSSVSSLRGEVGNFIGH